MTEDTNRDHYSPFLLDGVTPEECFTAMEAGLGHDECIRLRSVAASDDAITALAVDIYHKQRLLALWDAPRNDEERRIAHMARLGVPIGLHSLLAPEARPHDVTPVICRLGSGEWRVGWEDEDGPIFDTLTPKAAFEKALAWIGSDDGEFGGLILDSDDGADDGPEGPAAISA